MRRFQSEESQTGLFSSKPSLLVQSTMDFNLQRATLAEKINSLYLRINDISSCNENKSDYQNYMINVALGATVSMLQKMDNAVVDIQSFISRLMTSVHLRRIVEVFEEVYPPYPYSVVSQDLCQYSPGYVGDCSVTVSLGNNQIYITEDKGMQVKISNLIKDYVERKEYQTFTEKPNYGEVFAIMEDKIYYRVMIDPTPTIKQLNNSNSFSVFLLDYGDVWHNITARHFNLYRLGKKLQCLRSQVIFCKVQSTTIDISEALIATEKINFSVNDVIGTMLNISLVDKDSKNPFSEIRSIQGIDEPVEALSYQTDFSSQESIHNDCVQKTEDSYYEFDEQFHTRNEARGILAKTNIVTEESWKQALSEGCTKFCQKHDFLCLDDIPDKEYKVGDKFVCKLLSFFKVATVFAIDTDYERNVKKIHDYLNRIDWLCSAPKLDEPPRMHMRVIAPYTDNCFYRAKIVHIYPGFTMKVKVFYLDYGNFNNVRIDELKKWDHQLMQMNPKTMPLRIAGIEDPEDVFDLIVKREKLNDVIYTFGGMTATIIDNSKEEKVVELMMDDGTNFVEFLTNIVI